ncbi:MAG: hypothetical protein JSV98_05850 [candidate division WOR-3 bacterium]|nr:MAG: hypothetical protein JSV98_05850 [candidate division WOR-3 bacterium]
MTCSVCKKTTNLGAVIISVLVILAIGCMDPDEYKPEEPPEKTDPPEGPSVLLPLQDTLFRCEYYRTVLFDWTGVDSAQGYEFQIDRDSTFTTAFPYQGFFPPYSFEAFCFPPVTTYYFRVRAYSDLWTWYTDWSDTRRFHLISVQDDTIFN